ncbi:uncharacterized protein LOC112430920 isoform X3 [Maylandia zebra]|nr:uncharacterized protein LOC112430920 isoform X2 [Maylandia zebra]
MTERMSERLFPKVKDQVKFLSAVEKLKDGRQHKEKHTVSALQLMFNCKVQFPPAVITALTNKDAALKSPTKNRLKNMLIQALFDHLSNETMYPSHVQYVERLRTVLLSFPLLKESYGSGSADSWWRYHLVFARSVLLEEASMLLKTDVDKKVIRGFSKLAAKLVSIAPNSNLKSLCLKSVDESQTDTERKGQMVNTAVLLLPSIFKENASHLFVINKDPHSPIPTIVLSSSDGKPLSDSTEVNVQMDGQKMILDSGEMDISLAMGIVFSLYHVYNVAYPSELKKTFCFLEAFVLNLGTLTTPVPVAVQRVTNALNIS